jgi:hypothetical protein
MNAHGIAAPEPRVMVTVLGVGPDDVWVFDARQAHSETDLCESSSATSTSQVRCGSCWQ